MVAVRFDWQSPPTVIVGNLNTYRSRVLAGLTALASLFAARMEAYAKANAPWADRTGAARQGLTGIATTAAAGVVITLFGAAAHTIFLELGTSRMSPRPIIVPTMDAHVAAIAAALRALVGG